MWGAIGVSIFFLLSGYGNYFSTQSGAGARWLFRRIIHIFVPYTVSFIYLLAVYVFLFKQPFTITFVKNYFSLTIPYTSEWYLKVQILMYIFILISCTICIKSPTNYLFLLTLVYIALCLILKLPDYWWMTVMCFPLGFACAEFKSRIITILSSRSFLFTMGIVCTATLILRLKTESQPVILILYHILIAVFAISILVQSHFYSRALELLGKHSILVYLIHIGLVEMCFSTQFNIWLRAILYISLTFVGTVVCVLISDSLLKKYF